MIGPMLRSFARHKLTLTLLVVEVAVTCALACNVVHLAMLRIDALAIPSGVDERHLALIDSLMLDTRDNYVAAQRNDIEALRRLPGVAAVAAVDSVPLNKNNWTLPLGTAPPGVNGITRKPSIYTGTPGSVQALGLRLLAGRDFLDNEFQPVGSAHGYAGITTTAGAIVTRQLANKYFPGSDALGRSLYLPNGHPVRIIGIVEHLLRPDPKQAGDADDSVLVPLLPDQSEATYALRLAPAADVGAVLGAAKTALAGTDSQRLLRSAETYADLRVDYFSADQAMLRLLYAAGAGLIVITVVSVAGLANFWVLQRKRQIGIRRAIGATRQQICRYFQLENLMLVGAGAVLGDVLALALGRYIMRYYEAPALPYFLLPIVAVLFCCTGQLAVLAPALSASRIAPVAAIRKS